MKFLKTVACLSATLITTIAFICFGGNQKFTSFDVKKILYHNETELVPGAECKAEISINIEWPTGGIQHDALRRMQQELIISLFGKEYIAPDINEAIKKYDAKWISRFKEENSPVSDFMDGPSWGQGITGTLETPYGDIVNYVTESYEYTGGAHGMYWTDITCFNIRTGKTLTEESIFKYGYEKELTNILKNQIIKTLDKDIVEGIWMEDVAPNGNFRITEYGLKYLFNPYEIAAYVIGTIEVNVSWDDIRHILK